MLFWLTSEIFEEELDGMLGRPVILLAASPVENRLLLVFSSGGGSGAIFSGSAIETTVKRKSASGRVTVGNGAEGSFRHSTPL